MRVDTRPRHRNAPRPDQLRELIDYNHETGVMTWRVRSGCNAWNAKNAGKPALAAVNDNGYLRGSVLNRLYYAHRIAWAIYYGEWPNVEIDHINHDRRDNRISNLRLVTRSENTRNVSRSAKNTSGVTGVHWKSRERRWCAEIKRNRKSIVIGLFMDFDAAVSARKAAEREFDFHPNHGQASQ